MPFGLRWRNYDEGFFFEIVERRGGSVWSSRRWREADERSRYVEYLN